MIEPIGSGFLRRWRSGRVTLSVAAALTAGCGGAPNLIDVQLTDAGIQMASAVPSGSVEFRVRNTGTRDHSIKLVGGGLEVESSPVRPGETTSLKTTLATSRFDVFCAVGDHTSKERSITITAAPPQS